MIGKQDATRHREGEPATAPELTVQTGERENAALRWLLDGDRSLIIVLLSVGVFVVFLGLGLAGVIGVTEPGPVSGAFASALTGVFALVTITVSINQLVLSRVLGSPGDIRDRVESVQRFREDVEEMHSQVAASPSNPVGFLSVVTEVVRGRALHLRGTYGADHGPRQRAQVDELTATVVDLANHVDRHVGEDDRGLYQLLSPILNNSYSRHLDTLQYVEAATDDLAPDERAAIDDLAEALELINLTRHCFKTLYIHEELSTVSQRILLTGIPAGVPSFAAILVYAGGLPSTVGALPLLLGMSAAVSLVFVPLSICSPTGSGSPPSRREPPRSGRSYPSRRCPERVVHRHGTVPPSAHRNAVLAEDGCIVIRVGRLPAGRW